VTEFVTRRDWHFGLKHWRIIRNCLVWGSLPGILLISSLFLRVSHFRYSFFIFVAA
jgi:hypothetical protein